MRAIWFLLLLTLAASALSAQVPDILYYKFDETSGALARNHADPGQGWTNGALSAPPVWNTTDPIIGPASLDNTGQGRRMNTGYSMSERNGQAFTIELWFRTNSNGYQDFCNDSNTFGVWMYNGTVQVYMNGGIRLQTGAGLNDGQWHYMALTRNGGNTLTLYWGNATGTLNSTTANYNMTFSSNALGVLYWQGTVPATYNGEMDEFRLWGSQRSGAELQADRFTSYNTGDMDVFDSSNLYIKHQGTAAVTNVPAASASSHTFTIQNTRSSGNITFTPVTLSSPTGCSAVVTANPSTVTPGSTTTFTIQITPSQTEWSVDVDINNDRSPNPYQFTFTGMVNTGRPEMLYYRFNEGTGNQTVNDAAPSRGNNPATFSAGPNWFTPAQLGPYAAGSTANLPTGFSCINLPRPEFTLEFWVRRTSNSTNTICGDNSAFRIYHQGQDLHIQAGPTNGDQDIDTGINLGNGTWTHLAFVSDPGNYGLRIYVNGTQQFQQVNYTFPFTNAELYVFSNGGTDQFAGQIDEFRFWAHVRSQSQIAADMNVELIGSLEVQRPAANAIANGGNDPVGNVNVGATQGLTYTLANAAAAGLLLGSPAVIVNSTSNCTVNITSNPSNTLVTAGSSTTAQVEVTPTGTGPFTFQLQFDSNDPDNPSYLVNGSGTGIGVPQIQLERPSGSAIASGGSDNEPGTVAGATTSLFYTIRNTGSATLNITGQGFGSNVNCGVVVNAPGSASLAPGATTTMQVDVTPATAGAFSFVLSVSSNDAGTPTYTVNFSDTAAPGGEIDVERPVSTALADGSTDNLGSGHVAGVGTVLTYRVFNNGSAVLNIGGAATSAPSNCVVNVTGALPASIPTGNFADLEITVTPGAAGNFFFDITITSDDVDEGTYNIHADGTSAPGGEIGVERPVGTPIADGANDGLGSSHVAGVGTVLTYRVFNTGTSDLNISGTVTSAPSNCVANVTGALPSAISAGNFADLEITVTPSASGNFFFDITITSDDVDEGAYNIHALGTSAPGGEINVQRPIATNLPDGSTDNLSGSYIAGITDTLTYRVFNNGTADLTISGNSISGAINCVAGVLTGLPATIASGSFADLQINVTPAANGNFSFDIDIVSDDVDEANYDIHVQGVASPGGEIDIERPVGTPVSDGSNDNLGSSHVAGVGSVLTYRVFNNGSATLNIASTGLTGASNCTPVVTGGLPSTIAAGNFADLEITVTPGASGNFFFDITVTSDDVDEGTYNIHAQGTSAPGGEINVQRPVGTNLPDASTDDIGSSHVAGVASVLTYRVFNTGTADLSVSGASTSNAVNCAAGVTTSLPATITAGTFADMVITVTPSAGGNFHFDIDITSDDVDEANYDILADGNADYRDIEVDQGGTPVPTTTTYPQTGSVVGVQVNLPFNISNGGTADLTLNPPRVSVVSSSGVTINTITPPGGSGVLPGGTNAGFSIDYTPTSTTNWNFVVEVYSDDPVDPTYTFTVEDLAPTFRQIEVDQGGSPISNGGTYSLSGTVVGVAINLPFNIHNAGTADITLTGGPFVAVAPVSGVSINSVGQPGGATVVAGGNSGFGVDFTPTSSANWSYTVSIDSNDPAVPTFSFTVEDTNPTYRDIEVDQGGTPVPTAGTFLQNGSVVGVAANLAFNIANLGTGVLTLNPPRVAVVSSTGVTINTLTPPGGSGVLAPAGNVGFSVDYTPTSTVSWNFVVEVYSDDPVDPTYSFTVQDNGPIYRDIEIDQGGTPVGTGTIFPWNGSIVGVGANLGFNIANIGTADATLQAPLVAVVSSSGVTINSVNLPGSSSVVAGGNVGFSIDFTPTSTVSWNFVVEVYSDDPATPVYTFAVQDNAPIYRDIEIDQGGTPVPDAGTHPQTGSIVGVPVNLPFNIANVGTAGLTLTGAPNVQVAPVSGVTINSVTQPGSSSVAGGGNVGFSISYTPTSATNWSFTVSIDSDDPATPTYNFTVQDNAPVYRDIEVDQGGTPVPDTSSYPQTGSIVGVPVSLPFNIANVGTAGLTLTGAPNVQVTPVSGVTINGVTQPGSSSVAGGGNVGFSIDYTPTSTTNWSFTVSIDSDDPATPAYTFTVQDSAPIYRDIEVDQGGTPVPDTTTYPQTGTTVGVPVNLPFNIANVGTAGLTLTGAPNVQISSASGVTINSVTQPGGSAVAGGGNVGFSIDYTPTSNTNWSFTVSIDSDDPATPTYTFTVQDNAPVYRDIEVDQGGTPVPDTTTYPQTGSVVGVPASLPFNIANAGTTGLTLTGAPNVQVSPVSGVTINGVTQPGSSSVAGGGSVGFSIDYTPTSTGNWSFTVSIDSDDPATPTYSFTVEDTAPTFRLIQLDQGGSPIGNTATYPQTGSVINAAVNLPFNITNGGTADLTLQAPRVSVVASSGVSGISVTPPGGTGVLPNGASVGFSIDYTPTNISGWEFDVEVYSDDPATPTFTFKVQDTAPVYPVIAVDQGGSPTSNGGFVDQTGSIVGVPVNLPFNIANAGTSDLTLTGSPRVQLVSSSGVTVAVNQPGGTGVLGVGGNVGFSVDYTPTSTANWNFVLQVASDDPVIPSWSFTVRDTAPVYRDIEVDQGGTPVPDTTTYLQNGTLVGVATNLAFNIANAGNTTLTLQGSYVAVVASSGVSGVGVNPPGAAAIAGGGNAGFSIDFTPTSTVGWSFDVEVYSDDPATPTYTFTVQDNSPVYRDIEVDQGGTPVPDTTTYFQNGTLVGVATNLAFNIANAGNAALTLQGSYVSVVASSGVSGIGVNPPGAAGIAGGGNAGFSIDFTPTSTSSWSIDVEVYSDDPATPAYAFTVQDNSPAYRDIEIDQGGTPVPDTTTYFQNGTLVGVATNLAFNIANAGNATLTLQGSYVAVVSSSGVSGVGVNPPGAAGIAGGGNAGFSIDYTPTSTVGWSFDVEVYSDDPATPTYTFTVQDNSPAYRDIEIDQGGTPVPDATTYTQNGTLVGVPANLAFNIHNAGNTTLTLQGSYVSVVASSGVSGVGVNPPGAAGIAGGGNAGFSIGFTPTSTSSWSFDVEVYSDDPATPTYTFTVQDNGPVYRDIEVDQGGTPVPDTTTYLQNGTLVGVATNLAFNIANAGNTTLTLQGSYVAVVASSGVSGVGVNPPGAAGIAGGGNAAFSIDFTPTSTVGWSFDVEVYSDDPATPTYTFTVQDNSPVYRDIEVDQGGTPVPDTTTHFQNGSAVGVQVNLPFNISNAGNATLTLQSSYVAVVAGSGVTIVSVNPPGAAGIAGGGSAGFSIDYTPTSTVGWSFDVEVYSDDPATPTYTFTVQDNTPTYAIISIDQGGAPFSNGQIVSIAPSYNGVSDNTAFNLRNNGTANLDLTGSPFAVNVTSSLNVNATVNQPGSTTVAPAGNQPFDVDFQPTAAAAWNFVLEIVSNDPANPVWTITVQGNASNAPVLSFTPSVSYGSYNLGTSSPAFAHPLTNIGGSNLIITSITLIGPDAARWSIALNPPAGPPPYNVLPTGTVPLEGIYTPNALTSDIAQIEIISNTGGVPNTVSLIDIDGSGTFGDVTSASPVVYPSVAFGSSGSPLSHTLNSAGTGPVRILNITKSGPDSAAWALGSTPGYPYAMASGANVNFTGTFTPTHIGTHNAQFIVDWDEGPGTTAQQTLIDVSGDGIVNSTVTNVTTGPDNGGPVQVQADVNGTGGSFIDVAVTYAGGTNPGPATIVPQVGLTVVGNVIQNVPANTTLTFYWDAFDTEGNTTAANYVITLSPSIGAVPGTPGSSPVFALDRTTGWSKVGVASPIGEQTAPVSGHVMVHDTFSDRLVVFGGDRSNVLCNETWAYDFATGQWHQLHPTGSLPPARRNSAAVYDSLNNRMVVFGGYDGTFLNDTWALDLTPGVESWSQIAGGGTLPKGRNYSSLVMDDVNQRAILHGGYSQGQLRDTWVLDLTLTAETWNNAAIVTAGVPNLPSNGHSACFDPATQLMVLFRSQYDEVWTLDFNAATPTWTNITPGGATPGVRGSATAIFDPLSNSMIVQGGAVGDVALADTWSFSLTTGTWTQLADEPESGGRRYHTAVYDSIRQQMVSFGGRDINYDRQTNRIGIYKLTSPTGWLPSPNQPPVSAGPEPRAGAVLVNDSAANRLVLFGGELDGSATADVWTLDRSGPAMWTPLSVAGTPPAARGFAASAFDATGRRLFVFGGLGGGYRGDVWELQLQGAGAPQWIQLDPGTGPSPRFSSSMVYDPAGNQLVMFGGRNTGNLDDLWFFDLNTNTWAQQSPGGTLPTARSGQSAIYDSVNQRMVMFFGRTNTAIREVWALSLGGAPGWTDISSVQATQPAPRWDCGYTAFSNGTHAYIVGGRSNNTWAGDMWELDASTTPVIWTKKPYNIPGGRVEQSACMDNANNFVYGFGKYHFKHLSELLAIDPLSATPVPQPLGLPAAPPNLIDAQVAYDPAGRRMIAWSGTVDGSLSTVAWELDLAGSPPGWQQLNVGGASPLPRTGASFVYDGNHSPPRMVMYGGQLSYASGTAQGDLWALELTPGSEQWVKLTPTVSQNPGRRSNHSAVVDGAGNMLVFGGRSNLNQFQNNVFQLDLTTLNWSLVSTSGTPPAARENVVLAYDGLGGRNRLVMHGGSAGIANRYDETWELDLNTFAWSLLSTGGPPACSGHAGVIDPDTGTLMIFGGSDGATFDGFWSYDLVANSWTQIAPAGDVPQSRWHQAMVWDSVAHRLVMVGGETGFEGNGLNIFPLSQDNGAEVDVWYWRD